jgi:glycosyltransferase 2 family protein
VRGGLDLVLRLARSFWIRALVSAGLLALVATRIDFGAGTSRLSHGRWGWLVAAVAAIFTSLLVGAGRWSFYLRAARVERRLSSVFRAYLIGAFTTNFLPSQAGGDVTRAWLVSRRGTRMRAATTVVVDRVTALGCLIVVAWVAFALDHSSVPGTLVAALAATSGAFAAGWLVVALALQGGGRIAPRLPARLIGPAREAGESLRACVARPVLWRTSIIGLGFQALIALAAWLIARSITLGVPFSALLTTLPVVVVLAAAPISIGGLGVREGSYVVLLGQAGVGATEATLFSLMTAATFAIASVPGGLALLQRGERRATTRVDSAARSSQTAREAEILDV